MTDMDLCREAILQRVGDGKRGSHGSENARLGVQEVTGIRRGVHAHWVHQSSLA